MNRAKTSSGMKPPFFKFIYKPLVRWSARHILQGRLLDPDDPAKGRWLRTDVTQVLAAIWKRVDELMPGANLAALPTFGNRHMVYLAIVTTAAYQVLLKRNLSPDYAADLTADVGWKLYALGINVMAQPFRLLTRDTGKRIGWTMKALMVFPFSAPGRPGYEVKVWREEVVGQFEILLFISILLSSDTIKYSR